MRRFFLVLAWLLVAGPISAQEAVNYARDVKHLFKERCFSCHGGLKQKAGLLDTAALMREGGDNGPALIPGHADKSLLLKRITSKNKRMPPVSEGEPLTDKQIALIKAWIDQGAKGPAGEKAEEDPRRHWAFRTVARPPLPNVKDPTWQRNPIDAFLAAEHEKQGLTPQGPASRSTLLRRVYLDLIGLPPTREELHAFLADTSADAYEKVVERLLASPHHGERWGRHWMDIWRYSDWYGRRAVPDVWNSAPQIWRWRDWIVNSLNGDKGYDRMVMEMLAADEIAPEDDEAGVATGYIVRNWYALNPHQWMRDMVEHTGKAFLGLTFNCAHCHDHEYDPIAHEDYFRFRAFFEPVNLRQDRWPGEGDPGPFQKYDYSVLRKVVKIGSVRVFDEKLDAKTYMYLQGDERLKVESKPLAPGVPAFLGKVNVEPVALPETAAYPGLKPFIQKEELARCEKQVAETLALVEKARAAGKDAKPAPTALEFAESRHAGAVAELKSVQARITADIARFKKVGKVDDLARAASMAERQFGLSRSREKWLQARQDLEQALHKVAAAKDGKDKVQAALIVKKAETHAAALKKAVEAAEKTLAAVSDKYSPFSPVYPASSTGRRRALAQWIASKDNPLTARVAVNHIWMRHFDKPLVETVFDFGRNGKRPSHPELLDWLAAEFMDPQPPLAPPSQGGDGGVRGWSMKHLHRLIVTSNAYRMQSAADKDSPNLARDVDNKHLWRFNARRLEAELVRDSLLYLAGELDRALGGAPLENNQEMASKRRSLYFSVYPEDGGHPKFLEIFDAPDPCDCYRRDGSVMPQQALALTNNELAVNQGRLLARKLWAACGATGGLAEDDAARELKFVVAAFEQVLGRAPSEQEQTLCREFLTRQRDLYRQTKAAPAAPAGGTVGPSSDPALRARESLVRVLFNHNDFVMIR